MRSVLTALLVAALCASIAGCTATGEIENHAYALVLGIDQTDAGGIRLTIRMPRVGQTQPSGASDSGASAPYLTQSAEGADYNAALEQLQWTTAREVNLSQLKLIVVSEALAGSNDFRGLIQEIADTRHLYTTAAFVVCQGSAQAFVGGMEAVLGTRLSVEIAAMLRHYADHGYIPYATFADLYYATRSVFSDPTGIWAFKSAEETPARSPRSGAIVPSESDIGEDASKSDRHYLGACVFRDGRVACRLDARDTLCLGLASRSVGSFTWSIDGRAYTLLSVRHPRCRVRIAASKVEIDIDIALAAEAGIEADALEALRRDLGAAVLHCVQVCQSVGAEPFGFAEAAAGHFLTLKRWQAFDWRSRFSGADISVSVGVASTAK